MIRRGGAVWSAAVRLREHLFDRIETRSEESETVLSINHDGFRSIHESGTCRKKNTHDESV